MEIPFNYIVLIIFRTLKYRNQKMEIERSALIKSIKEILKELPLSQEDLRELIFNFDFNLELDNFVNEYSDYAEYENNKLTFDDDINIYELEDLVSESKEDIDIIFKYMEEIIEENVIILDVIGVKIKKDLYHYLLNDEKKLEELYNKLRDEKNNKEEIINKIKYQRIKNNIMFINMETILEIEEYFDLSLYANWYFEMHDEKIKIPFKINKTFNTELVHNDTIQRSLFLVEPSYTLNLKDKIDTKLNKLSFLYDDIDISKLSFYLSYLDELNKEIELMNNEEVKKELMIAKYRLMNSLDSIYDTLTFMKQESINEKFTPDYGFAEKEVYFFINEVLEYEDKKYYMNNTKEKDICVTYYNIIKKIFVKVYYDLTKDKDIIFEIKNNPNYGINKISSNMFEDIVNGPKKKTLS